jgi:cyclopropane-fatty-acyl-phospholipid synthase
MSAVTARAVNWIELGFVPDTVIRAGIRRMLETKRREMHSGDAEVAAEAMNRFVDHMNESPVALVPELANEQHYEVPADFFVHVMGEHLKYSCGYWPQGVSTLSESERAALGVTTERAGIEDGMSVLDLGCGWGSFSLWIAGRFPNAQVTAVSNSASQREFILSRAAARGLGNIEVLVADMNEFDIDRRFDRVVSIEMFEHMRNWGELYRRIAGWLKPDGKFFKHVFCHHSTPYPYENKGPGDWMSRHFFTGGMMPAADLPLRFPRHLNVEKRWHWNGKHYARTCNAWLERMDSNRQEIMPVLEACYGESGASLWWQRWRIFFMACAEFFDYNEGQEWFVGHYLLSRAG